jgi:hypothetical protein
MDTETTAPAPSSRRPAGDDPAAPLRQVVGFDAALCAVNGLAYLAGAAALDSVLGLPATFLRWVGVFLVAYAALVAVVATRATIPRLGVRAVVEGNAAWVVASVVLAVSQWSSPTAAGTVWIVAQAVVVAVLAVVQHRLLGRVADAG